MKSNCFPKVPTVFYPSVILTSLRCKRWMEQENLGLEKKTKGTKDQGSKLAVIHLRVGGLEGYKRKLLWH